MTDEDVPDSGLAWSLTAVTAAGLGSAAGLAVSGPAAGIIGAIGVQAALEFTGQLWNQLAQRRRLNATVPLAYAATELHQPIDEITERLASDTEMGPITATVLMGAAATQSHEKLLALGRVLTNIIEDRARIDEEQFVASALNQIEAPHLRMLDFLEQRQTMTGRLINQYSLGKVGLGTAFSPVMNTLENAGLVERHSMSETRNGSLPRYNLPGQELPKIQVIIPHWSVTDLGKLVMQRLRQAAEEARGAPRQGNPDDAS